jgi:glycosyltransferase involved in cell wall biosynthesis
MTYNHSSYITDAMNGFVMQQTTFPFVCTIIDDASTDGEQEVLRNYLNDFFNLQDASIADTKVVNGCPVIFARHKTNHNCHFAVVLLSENHHRLGKSKAPYIAEWLNTKYLSICEGDDFWTDPLKLQKQVDYLESHPECTLCFTNAIMRWEDGSERPDRLFAPNLEERDYSGPEMTEEWITPTASFVYRHSVIETDFYKQVLHHQQLKVVGDIPLVLTCARMGTVHALADVTCVYRRQPKGFMLSADSTVKMAHGDYRYAIFRVFGREYLNTSVNKAIYHYRLGVSYAKKEHNWENYFKLLKKIIFVYFRHPYNSAKRVLKIYQEKKGNAR